MSNPQSPHRDYYPELSLLKNIEERLERIENLLKPKNPGEYASDITTITTIIETQETGPYTLHKYLISSLLIWLSIPTSITCMVKKYSQSLKKNGKKVIEDTCIIPFSHNPLPLYRISTPDIKRTFRYLRVPFCFFTPPYKYYPASYP